MKQPLPFVLTSAVCLCLGVAAKGGIIEDLASARIVEDFQFNDVAGTGISAAANSASSHLFDNDGASSAVVTNGAGQLNVSLKNNTDFATHFVDNDNLTYGRVLGVMELTWDFDTTTFDPDADEELRITLTNNDPRGTQVTAELEIQRNGLTDLEINGNTTSHDDLGPVSLNISQATKFIAVVDANLDNHTYQIHFSDDGGTTFTSLGPGAIDPTRIVNALRFGINEDYVGDNVLIDRVYLAHIPEPSSIALVGLALAAALGCRRRTG